MLDGKITISRPQCSDGKEYISVTIQDELSGIRFLDIQISYSDFAQCLTGLAMQACKMEIRGLNLIGKKKEMLPFEFEIPANLIKKDAAIVIGRDQCPHGWVMSEYFGSQNSFYHKDGKQFARTTISRWVDVEQEKV